MKKLRIKEKDIRRLTLRGWAAIDDKRRSIEDASKEGESFLVSNLIFEIIEFVTSKKLPKETFWMDVAGIYGQVIEKNNPTKIFPILTSKEKSKPLPWEYLGRSWYFWLNLFAENYGWSEDQVSSMDIDTAIALYQEIIISGQLENEWQYGLSEIAYQYNPSTKKSHFKPLPRPDWMRGIVGKQKPVKTSKIPVAMMPAGVVINLDETQPTKNTPE